MRSLCPLLLLAPALAWAAPPALETVVLDGFPFVRQKPDFCGEADVEMAARRLGRSLSQDEVFAASGVDPLKGRGAWTNELASAARNVGFEPGPVWFHVDPKKAPEQIDAQFKALHADLVAGIPSIVCMHYDEGPQTTENFRLVTGYDAAKDEVVYQEPAEDEGGNRRMARAKFLALWTFKPAKDRWTLIKLRLAPAAQKVEPNLEPSPTAADLAQRVIALKEIAPKGMTMVWVKPFLVIGNEAPDEVRRRSRDVVKWAQDLLLKDFFPEAPDHIEEVWVFKDDATYRKYSRELFKTDPDTPYGYYLSSRRAMVMNIRPGYGTLTHEMVHPFMRHNWANAPAWLNEGLGSLFERPSERDGHLVGKVNWRLPSLHAALKAKQALSFKALLHLDDEAFYADETGVHYAQARYLCYWLQERGLLVKFVQKALANKAKDRSGWKALEEVLGADPESFRPQWEKFVLELNNV